MTDIFHVIFGQSSEWFWVMVQSVVIGVTLIFLVKQLRIQSKANSFLAEQLELQSKANQCFGGQLQLQSKANQCFVDQLQLQSKAHLVNAFAVMNDRWRSPILLMARMYFCRDWKHNAKRISPAVQQVAMFFEEMGAYCKKGILDLDIAWELYSFEVEHYWVMAENSIISFRTDKKDLSFYRYFEWLYKQMQLVSAKKNAPSNKRMDAEVEDFIQLESETVELLGSVRTPMSQVSVITGVGTRDILAPSAKSEVNPS